MVRQTLIVVGAVALLSSGCAVEEIHPGDAPLSVKVSALGVECVEGASPFASIEEIQVCGQAPISMPGGKCSSQTVRYDSGKQPDPPGQWR